MKTNTLKFKLILAEEEVLIRELTLFQFDKKCFQILILSAEFLSQIFIRSNPGDPFFTRKKKSYSLKVAVSSNIYRVNLTINNNNKAFFYKQCSEFTRTKRKKNFYRFIISSDFIDLSS